MTQSEMSATPMLGEALISMVAVSDDLGVTAAVGTVRALAERLGASGDAAALAVRLLGDDALRRLRGFEASPLAVSAHVDGTELVITFIDKGEPVQGALLGTMSLADLGVVTGVDGGTIAGGNSRVVRLALPSHLARIDDGDQESSVDDQPLHDGPVTMRELEVDDAPSLVRCLFRCYGWSYPGVDMYFPARVAAMIRSGRRIGEVAVDADGEVIAHWGAKFVAEGVVETGVALTDPRYRRRGLANELGERLLARLPSLGVVGRLREPVLTHSATQQIALREGAHIVGVYLHAVTPLNQVGITEGALTVRTSITVMYSPLQPLTPSVIWVPHDFESIIRRILEPTDWGRSLGEVRGNVPIPENTEASSSFDTGSAAGFLDVTTVGRNLVDVVDDALVAFKRAGAQVARVTLPASQETLAVAGSGLADLGLSFAAFLPAFGTQGDVIVLQWLAEPVSDEDTWAFASDRVKDIVRLIVEQSRSTIDAERQLRLRRARRQRLFAALPSADD